MMSIHRLQDGKLLVSFEVERTEGYVVNSVEELEKLKKKYKIEERKLEQYLKYRFNR